MSNQIFLARWPTGRASGYIGYSHSLKRALVGAGQISLLESTFEVLPVIVFNTGSLKNGMVEARSSSEKMVGTLFLPVEAIFDSEEDAAADINSAVQGSIKCKERAIEKLKLEIQVLESNKIR